MPGAELKTLGRYTLERVLGRGAMGVVYEGLDPKLDRRVAIKTILKSNLDDNASRDYSARFVREAHAVARLNHPNIVQVYDFGEEGDIAYIVMEFIRGKELQSFFNAKERFELKEAVRIMGELCKALDFAHQAGIIHRDVKPANVMLDGQGNTKLTDFGVARVQDIGRSHATQAGTLVGTPAYMSPEQITGGTIDRRTDVFSAGIVLYQFLTGEMPFTGGGPWTIAKKIMQDQPVQASSINTSVTPLFDAVVNRALAKDPDERFQSARALGVALQRALEGKPEEDDAEKTVVHAPARAAKPPAPAAGAQGTQPGSQDAEVEFWRSIKDSNEADDFDLYIQQFPNGIYAGLAKRKIAKLRGDADEQARRDAEARAKLEAEERARQEIEVNARREAEEEAKRQAEERARREAAAKAKRDAEERARQEAEQKKRAAEEKTKREAELLRRKQEEARKRRPAESPAEETVALRTRQSSTPPKKESAPVGPIVAGALLGVALAVIAGVGVWYATRPSLAPTQQAQKAEPKPEPPGAEQQKAAAAERAAAEKAVTDRFAAEKAAAEKALAEAKAAAERATAEKLAAQKAVADLAAAERAAADRATAARLATERVAAERVAAEKAAADRKAEMERAAAEKAAVEKAAAAKLAAEKALAERAAAEKAKAETAKLASAAPAASTNRFPQLGDTWTYRLTEPKRSTGPKQRTYVVKVAEVSASGIRDQVSIDGAEPTEGSHSKGRYLFAQGASIFSPYLPIFEDISLGARLGSIEIKDDGCKGMYACDATARVVGRESVKVPAGSFDAIKVAVEHIWQPASGSGLHQAQQGLLRGARNLIIWYAPAVKRAVKFSSRLNFGDYPPIETDFDLELVSYQLK